MTLGRDRRTVAELGNDELLVLRGELEKELRNRGVSFSVGEIGERLCVAYFNATPGLPNLQQGPIGAKNVDALSRDGDRYSIKTSMRTKKTGTIYPDDADSDKQLFEYLVVVRLGEDYALEAIYRFSWKAFVKTRAWDRRMNAWYVSLSERKLELAEAVFRK